MDEKIEIPLYVEHLYFLLSRWSWKVTKIRRHYTFEQKKFKRGFVIMNQVSRQKAQTEVEKRFLQINEQCKFRL